MGFLFMVVGHEKKGVKTTREAETKGNVMIGYRSNKLTKEGRGRKRSLRKRVGQRRVSFEQPRPP